MNEKTTSVAEMVEAAHQQAVKSGFWDDLDDLKEMATEAGASLHTGRILESMAVAQKLALISTEVMEFQIEAAKIPRDRDAMLEELADVVIRIFDLSGFLDVLPRESIFDLTGRHHSEARSCALALFSTCAEAVQSHRKGRGVEREMSLMIHYAQCYSTYLFEDRYALRRAIEAKMLVNESRPRKHGAAY